MKICKTSHPSSAGVTGTEGEPTDKVPDKKYQDLRCRLLKESTGSAERKI